MPARAEPSAPSLAEAALLGILHGPAELLPVSSSGHLTLIPWLLGREASGRDPEERKAFEVALHAGTAAALMIALRGEVGEALTGLDRRRVTLVAGSFLPPAVAGLALERPIERRLGTPATIAAGLIAGSVAMLVADRAPRERRAAEAGLADALWLGAAQACALAPGVSRGGATLAAARLRRFRRPDAGELSRHVALPVIVGAVTLKGVRLRRRRLPPGAGPALAAGTAASFISALAVAGLARRVDRDRSLAPYAAYRLALAAVTLGRIRALRENRAR
ncbi:MAG: undecaprenyl-diphosphate phosphatase [Solirubrobacteraceae bacterium]